MMGLSEDQERVALQERELKLPGLDARFAWELGVRMRTLAEERGQSVVIDVRRFGQPLFYCGAGGHYAGPSGVGAAQEQCGGAVPSQLLCDWD
jgi:uncharacterized protein (UPF0303 family)